MIKGLIQPWKGFCTINTKLQSLTELSYKYIDILSFIIVCPGLSWQDLTILTMTYIQSLKCKIIFGLVWYTILQILQIQQFFVEIGMFFKSFGN